MISIASKLAPQRRGHNMFTRGNQFTGAWKEKEKERREVQESGTEIPSTRPFRRPGRGEPPPPLLLLPSGASNFTLWTCNAILNFRGVVSFPYTLLLVETRNFVFASVSAKDQVEFPLCLVFPFCFLLSSFVIIFFSLCLFCLCIFFFFLETWRFIFKLVFVRVKNGFLEDCFPILSHAYVFGVETIHLIRAWDISSVVFFIPVWSFCWYLCYYSCNKFKLVSGVI